MCETLYCITSALDRYVTLPDRTPHTQMMMSHSICSKDICDPWYNSSEEVLPSVCPFASIQFASIQIASVQADHPWTKHAPGYHPQILQSWPDLWHS